jgi:hypothetical protein
MREHAYFRCFDFARAIRPATSSAEAASNRIHVSPSRIPQLGTWDHRNFCLVYQQKREPPKENQHIQERPACTGFDRFRIVLAVRGEMIDLVDRS